MRYIVKTSEPESFTQWKDLANDDWQPSYKELSGPVKRDVYQSLLDEQGYICCYCERELVDKDYHMEHLNPQCEHSGDDLDYDNLLCSCQNKIKKGSPRHCGNAKDDIRLQIHPLQEDCQQQFTYKANGKIDGENDIAKQTIKDLALDLNKLSDLRAKAMEVFLDSELTDDDLREFVEVYTANNEQLNPFVSAVEYVFRDSI